jgi:uncharacterized protein
MDGFLKLIAAALVGAAILACGYFIGKGLTGFRSENRAITVKGLAEKTVDADFAVWSLSFRRAGNEFNGVQQALVADREKVSDFLKKRGFTDAEMEVRPLNVKDLLAREFAQNNTQAFRFNGTGAIVVKTKRVQDVEKAALALDPLTQAGIQLAAEGEGFSGPRYQLQGFNAVKAELLSEATKSARDQATKFAAEAGATLGPLRTANQGAIRLSGDDGNEMDDGGSRVKRLRVVSTFEYGLR